MATVLNFEPALAQEAPRHWVAGNARARQAPLRGWLRDLGAIAEVLFADDIGPPDQQRVRWVCHQTRDFARTIGGKVELAFRASVFATSWVAPLLVLRAPPLRNLPYRDRLLALKRYETSPLRLSLFAVKVFTGLSWFEHPDVAREVRFDGQCPGARR